MFYYSKVILLRNSERNEMLADLITIRFLLDFVNFIHRILDNRNVQQTYLDIYIYSHT